MIRQCLPAQVLDDELEAAPQTEAELDQLQRVLAACDTISNQEMAGGLSWLNEDGKAFPLAVRSYIHAASSYFHSGDNFLPQDSVSSLVDWIHESRSHVTTLNYDDLLYRAFIGTKVLYKFDCLIDGFVREFHPTWLDRKNPARQSFYLHLHGSPLYYTDAFGSFKKSALSNLRRIEGFSTNHVVLTHVDHKSTVIAASPILSEYWKRLEEAFKEVEGLVLFGYGGGDDHLNRLIGQYFSEKTVEIIERKKPEYDTDVGRTERFNFWQRKFSQNKQVILLAHWCDDILKFKNWSYDHRLQK